MKYRKKPAVIEALKFNGTFDSLVHILRIFSKIETLQCIINSSQKVTFWRIGTPEGGHIVSEGDYIIKGVMGEFYPCKPDIFEMTYEKVEE